MARRITIDYVKTYATEANAEKAIDRLFGDSKALRAANSHLTYSINPVLVDGKIRYGVLFYGERAIQAGVHFHFNIAG